MATKYAVRIGQHGYYVSDDTPPIKQKLKAATFPTQEEAEMNASFIRGNWNLKPKGGATPKVYVVPMG